MLRDGFALSCDVLRIVFNVFGQYNECNICICVEQSCISVIQNVIGRPCVNWCAGILEKLNPLCQGSTIADLGSVY